MLVFFFYRQRICRVWLISVSTDDWYSNMYKLCSTTRWFVSTHFRQTSFKGFSRMNITETFHSSFHYIDDDLSLNNNYLDGITYTSKWSSNGCVLLWLSPSYRQRWKIQLVEFTFHNSYVPNTVTFWTLKLFKQSFIPPR